MATPVQIALSTGAAKFVRGQSCKLTSYSVYNPNTGPVYIQFFDTLLGPTVGTTVPVWALGVGVASATGAAAPTVTGLVPADIYFSQGLWVAATTGTLTGATAAGVDVSFGIS